MKNPRRSPDRFRKNGRSRSQQFYPPQLNQQLFEALLPPSSSRCGEGVIDKSSECDRGISILLLDAENLKLDVNAEKFLASRCNYPLQVKIAFANWKKPTTGKLDIELYDRGYELIHVPGGANSADGKMIAFGAAILYRYPAVKQVFVCSSDGLLNHLCNQLQNQGLTVFRVRRQNAVLSVENLLTGDTNHYSCKREEEVPTFEELANQIGEFLKAEHKSIDERIARFSSVAELFQERRTVAFNSTTSYVAALSESGENEVTPVAEVSVAVNQDLLEILPDINSNPIESLDVLKTILVEIIESAKLELKEDVIPVAKIKKDFFSKYQFQADLIVKQLLGNNSSLIKLLQSESADFKVILIGSEHQVAIIPKIESSEEG
ncbi:NYN domain-containing protein [Tychonema sp. BBK16]|uniref:NYN domain-containing protein n=1 Tax=Tychonema sp. BBK16 TaxID=2699888 RepID=UPI001F2A2F79|nr:NYN domain-containing protein [Tychonema sp. BBK16]